MEIDLLFAKGAVSKDYQKNEIIFEEGGFSNFYYQVIEGSVKLIVCNDSGKEFIQEYFEAGECFGVSPLFIGKKYIYTAVAEKDSSIIKLQKEKFLQILDENSNLKNEFLALLAHRLYDLDNMCKCIINQTPEFRIISFLDHYKHKKQYDKKEEIPFTRQEIADFTGLRVETAIRVISKLKEKHKLDIVNHKIFY
ncbi:MAG: Crp/Fnr family transcriptional regulator [Flavobacteriaceae bacterium]|jgi:CRP/FNR family transcriptional regulator|nr:Crp/Fnr family transcriptional regulator [Flavobacteriaceae bacterium]